MIVLLNRITDILFWPLFGVIVAGLLLFLFRKERFQHVRATEIVLLAAAVMIGWRIPLAGSSTRYWAAVLFPGILLIVGFCYAAEWGRSVARVLLAVLTVTCLLKDFRLNWNNRAITNAAAAVAEDAKQHRHVFVTEIRMDGLLERIAYYSGVPMLSSRYCDDLQVQSIYHPAQGLYDACYIILGNTAEENLAARGQIEKLGGRLLFAQDKDMRKKKKIYVYKLAIPEQKDPHLPISEHFFPNGDFEDTVARKQGIAAEHWWMTAELVSDKPMSGNYSVWFESQNDTASLLFSGNLPPPRQDGMMLFSVCASPGSHIRVYCIGHDENKKAVFRKTLANMIVPAEARHQFQIPIHVDDFSRAVTVNYRWYVISPRGMSLDDIGFYPEQQRNSK